MDAIKLLLAMLLKRSPQTKLTQTKSTRGFTLIELLVAMILAFLVITPLMGLAISLLNTDRQEQAKATSEQELQAAADFIARDLQQAVFIYDTLALTRPNSPTATTSGIQNQIPPGSGALGDCTTANCVPVLAFWKRRPVQEAVPITPGTNCKTATDAVRTTQCNDTFVYSLVAYYLIRDVNNREPWSSTARIGRFELTDGVRDQNGDLLAQANSRKVRNTGFQSFDLSISGPNLAAKMNSWKKVAGSNYTATADSTGPSSRPQMQILLDYIDQTPARNPNTPTAAANDVPREYCPTYSATVPWMQSPFYGAYNPAPTPRPTPPNAALQTFSFYACINQNANIAKVFLRGNAFARLQPVNNPPTYSDRQSSYFPGISIEVKGVGKLVQ